MVKSPKLCMLYKDREMTTNYAKVKELCDQLVQNGEAVSVEVILQECEGSTATILAHYQRWRSESQDTRQAAADTGTLSEEYLAAFHREIKRFSNTINRDFEVQLERAIEAEKFAILSLQKTEQITTELSEKVTLLETRLEEETVQFKQTIAEVEDNADVEIASLKEHHETQIQELTESKNQTIEDMRIANENTIEQLKTNSAATIAELKESNERTIIELKQTGEAKVTELTETVATQVQTLEAALQEKDSQIENLLQEKNSTLSQLSQLEQTANTHAAKAEQHTSEVEDLRKAKEAMQAQLKHVEQNLELLKKQNLELSQHNQDQQSVVKGAKAQIEEMQAQLVEAQDVAAGFESEKENLLKQMDFVKNNSTATIQRLTQNSDQNLSKIRLLEEKLSSEQNNARRFENENEKLQVQLEFIKHNSATTVERLTRSAEKAMARVRELEREVDDTKLELEQVRASNNVVPLQEKA